MKVIFYDVLLPTIKKSLEDLLSLIEQETNFIFYYDTLADQAGHGGFLYDDILIKDAYKAYQKIIKDCLDSVNKITRESSNEYLVLITTDHGRAKSGRHHFNVFPSAHKSWITSNQDLEEILGREIINLYDIKTVVYNWKTL